MSVIVEFTVADDAFPLGRALSGTPGMTVELERVVPTDAGIIPYLWVRGADQGDFERRVGDHETIATVQALDTVDDWVLYRAEWAGDPFGLLRTIKATDGAILSGRGTDTWHFQVRFPDSEALSAFYATCQDRGITIAITRTHTLDERAEHWTAGVLTPEQREAMALAFAEGYFATPSETTLSALAADLGISKQALSNRIRRGTAALIEATLATSPDGPP